MNQFSELFMNEIYLEEKLPTKNNILLQAFKLYLANNVDRVTVEDLEKNTGASRGAIFYHFQNKENIFNTVCDTFFFSDLNIFFPLSCDKNITGLNEYILVRKERLIKTIDWFNKQDIKLNPSGGFTHLMFQAKNHYPDFQSKLSKFINDDITEWKKAVSKGINKKEIKKDIDIDNIVFMIRSTLYSNLIGIYPKDIDDLRHFSASIELIYNSIKID